MPAPRLSDLFYHRLPPYGFLPSFSLPILASTHVKVDHAVRSRRSWLRPCSIHHRLLWQASSSIPPQIHEDPWLCLLLHAMACSHRAAVTTRSPSALTDQPNPMAPSFPMRSQPVPCRIHARDGFSVILCVPPCRLHLRSGRAILPRAESLCINVKALEPAHDPQSKTPTIHRLPLYAWISKQTRDRANSPFVHEFQSEAQPNCQTTDLDYFLWIIFLFLMWLTLL